MLPYGTIFLIMSLGQLIIEDETPVMIFAMLGSYLVSTIGFIATIYFMFKWINEYNLKTFGYRSYDEWKKSL